MRGQWSLMSWRLLREVRRSNIYFLLSHIFYLFENFEVSVCNYRGVWILLFAGT